MHLHAIAPRMSPYASAHVAAVLAGDDSTTALHGARHEIAAFADRLGSRNRRLPRTHGHGRRAEMIAAAQAAYDEIAARLAARGEL